MRSNLEIRQEIMRVRLIAIIRATSSAGCTDAVMALGRAGATLVEVTLTTPGALEVLADVRTTLPHITMGVGSVLTREDVHASANAGAEFIVTPIFRADIIAECNLLGLVVVSGAYTPTEAQSAYEAGADFVKIFPADVLGPRYVKAILGPLPHLQLIPTGGVDLTNIPDFIAAGCKAVAVGGNLVSQKLLDNRDFDAIEAKARDFMHVVGTARRL